MARKLQNTGRRAVLSGCAGAIIALVLFVVIGVFSYGQKEMDSPLDAAAHFFEGLLLAPPTGFALGMGLYLLIVIINRQIRK